MAFTSSMLSLLRVTLAVAVMLAGIIVLFLMYYQSLPSQHCHPPPTVKAKPTVLLWFWPDGKKFDLQVCKKLYNINSCQLTDDRSAYSRAHEVLVFHRAINDDLSNLPTSPRAKFQRWIWFNMDTPNNTRRIAGIERLFNLTMTYRKEADIHVRWALTYKKNTDGDFVLPNKTRLLCWIVDTKDQDTQSGEGYNYFKTLVNHIKVDVFYRTSPEFLNNENYLQTISSCKFYLSFETSIDRDYITETLNGPLAAGTVPIVLGPPRRNYEDSYPGSSFIHVNDFSDAAQLAEFLLTLDKDNGAYERYFDWRQFYTTTRHPTEKNQEFAHAICQACKYAGLKRLYRVTPDLYKWFFP